MTAPDRQDTRSRRSFLRLGAGTALSAGLLAGTQLLTTTTAAAAAPSAWPIVANGHQGTVEFYKRMGSGSSSAHHVGGGLTANVFGNPILAYGWGFGGLNFVRLCDAWLNDFQVYRSIGGITDDNGPGGHFYHYRWNGSRYDVTGPFHWKITETGPAPWQLPIDTTHGPDWAFHAQGGWNGVLRELHYFDEPWSADRNLWGRVFDESIVGYTRQNMSNVGASFWFPSGGLEAQPVYYYQAFYSFIRPLDTSFNAFQLYWGTDRREEYYQDFHPSFVLSSRGGEAIHFDVASGAQEFFTWNANL